MGIVRRDGTIPVHLFTVTRPSHIDGKHVEGAGTTFEVLVPGGYCDRQAALDLLLAHLPDGYMVRPVSGWRGDLSTVDHQRQDLDNYGDPHPGKGMKWAA